MIISFEYPRSTLECLLVFLLALQQDAHFELTSIITPHVVNGMAVGVGHILISLQQKGGEGARCELDGVGCFRTQC